MEIALAVAIVSAGASPAAADCADPAPEWLACEDFELGSLGWDAWFAQSPWVECNGCADGTSNPDRILLVQDSGQAHTGNWSLYLPAAAAANYQGASLAFRSCAGAKQQGCSLTNYDQLYFRVWVKLAPDHQMVHHFLALGGTRPDAFWESEGNAGCRPNGYRAAGATLDFDSDHELFFYTYFPDMHCDTGGYCSGDYAQSICDLCATKEMPCTDGLECCWGNTFRPDPPAILVRDQWVCLELGMRLNTPGAADGEMWFWVDDALGLHQTGMEWRDVAELGLNKAWLQHYIENGDATQSNQVWFDDVVVSTARIGCSVAPTEPDAGPSPGGDGGATTPDAGGGSEADGGSEAGDGSPGPPADDGPSVTGGCGCVVAPEPAGSGTGAGGASFWLVLLALLAGRRRS